MKRVPFDMRMRLVQTNALLVRGIWVRRRLMLLVNVASPNPATCSLSMWSRYTGMCESVPT